MNLIEQLGGYEKAKLEWEREGAYPSPNYFYYRELGYELLQYRRQHNIFEVGDLIRHKDDDLYMNYYGLLTVDRIVGDKVGFMVRGYIGVMYSCSFKHATPEEIKAEYRLD